MQSLITAVHIIAAALLVLVVLIQKGKGAEISASFAGSSQTVFGTSGGANFFTRFTAVCATVFMVTSITLTIMGGQQRKSLFESAPVSASRPATTAPVAPAGTTAPAAAPAAPATPAQGK